MTATRILLASLTALVVIYFGWGTPLVPAALFGAAIMGGLWGLARALDDDTNDTWPVDVHESHSLPTYFADTDDTRPVWPGHIGGVE